MRVARVTAYMFASVLLFSGHLVVAQQIVPGPHGITATAGGTSLEVDALRDDILRVRMWKGDAVPEDASWAVLPASRTSRMSSLNASTSRDDILRVRMWKGDAVPEDASWAVLPASRTSSVSVTSEPRGFATHALRVLVDEHLGLTVSDLSGNVVQKDASPVRWNGNRFTVSKQRETDDHFFGLGDKPGPLDRAGEVFTMWNTDAFGWQESTDPVYKSIPFFLHVSHGRTLGVFLDNTWRSNFDFGHADPSEYTFGAADGPIDYYLMYGPEPRHVVTAWSWLTGPTPL